MRTDTHFPILDVMLAPGAVMPSYGSDGAIGLDLFPHPGIIPYGLKIPCNEVVEVRTGVSVAIPPGWYGRVAPKGGPSKKFGLEILAGVIDNDYRGEIIVLVMRHSTYETRLNWPEDKAIAQLILERADRCVIRPVDELTTTARGEGRYGSTGR